jgi:hypothetical protein
VSREVEHRAGRLLRRYALRHQIGEHRDRDDQRAAGTQRLQPPECDRGKPRAERAGRGRQLGVVRVAAQRVPGAVQLSVQRLHGHHDAVAAGSEGAPLQCLLHQRLRGQSVPRGRIHDCLYTGGGQRVQPLGEPGVLSLCRRGNGEQHEKRDDPRGGHHSAHREHGDGGTEVALRGPRLARVARPAAPVDQESVVIPPRLEP